MIGRRMPITVHVTLEERQAIDRVQRATGQPAMTTLIRRALELWAHAHGCELSLELELNAENRPVGWRHSAESRARMSETQKALAARRRAQREARRARGAV